jgi:hypothetical protein
MNVKNAILCILILIVIILCASILYGSCVVYEKFETSSLFKEAPDPNTATPISNTAKNTTASLPEPTFINNEVEETPIPIPQTENDTINEPEISDYLLQSSPIMEEDSLMLPPPKNDESLNTREKELFDQIIKDNMSGEDLEKLIKAGAVTEKMVEKFLNELDKEKSGDTIEAFCASSNCYSLI